MRPISIMAILAFVAITNADKLTGRWESQPSASGSVTGVVFKENNSFEAYVNDKPFASGSYQFKEDVFTFTDNGCDGAQGVYKTIFFHHGDSLRFECIRDSCTERKEGMGRVIMGKVK